MAHARARVLSIHIIQNLLFNRSMKIQYRLIRAEDPGILNADEKGHLIEIHKGVLESAFEWNIHRGVAPYRV